MQLLINIEEEYRSYGEFIAAAIRQARPDDEVVLTQPAVLEEEIERTDPDLVISSPPIPANAVGERVAWVELSLDPAKPFRFRVGERRWESMNYTLYEVPSVVDQARDSWLGDELLYVYTRLLCSCKGLVEDVESTPCFGSKVPSLHRKPSRL